MEAVAQQREKRWWRNHPGSISIFLGRGGTIFPGRGKMIWFLTENIAYDQGLIDEYLDQKLY